MLIFITHSSNDPFNSHHKQFLDSSCRAKLSLLNERLTTLERRVEYIEARVSNKIY